MSEKQPTSSRKAKAKAPEVLTEFTVDRATWRRGGKGPGDMSQLLNAEGGMCCLGFYMQQCGATEDQLRSRGYPSTMPNMPEKGAWLDTDAEEPFVTVNDDKKIKDSTRERKLRYLFEGYGITVHFVGEPDDV